MQSPSRRIAGAELCPIPARSWDDVLTGFDDASIYQTVAYAGMRRRGRIEHWALKDRGEIRAAAQIVTLRVPWLRLGVAYGQWTPLWRRRGQPADVLCFGEMAARLAHEYVTRRGFALRLEPREAATSEGAEIRVLLEGLGFRRLPGDAYRTFTIDLSASLDEIRAGFSRAARRQLRIALRSDLSIETGDGPELVDALRKIHREMRSLKRFAQFVNPDSLPALQRTLASAARLQVMVAREHGREVAAIVCSPLGSSGLFYLGASNQRGRATRASYQLHWRMIEWLKQRGCTGYDLGGADPHLSPGTYRFKRSLAGPCAESRFLGVHQLDGGRTTRSLLLGAQALRGALRRLRIARARLASERRER
jgi:Acetyltransferase (GNAT) domain